MLRQSFAPMMSGYAGVTFEAAGSFQRAAPDAVQRGPGQRDARCRLPPHGAAAPPPDRGQGLYIENPQLNATMSHVAHIVRRAGGRSWAPAGSTPLQYGFGPFERLYRTADGWICIAAVEDSEIAALAELFELEGGALVADRMEERTTATWLALCKAAGVPAVEPAARNTHAFLNDPENRRTGRVAECAHATKGNVRELDRLVRVSDSIAPPHRLAPDLGAHTESILRAMGLGPDSVDGPPERADELRRRLGPAAGQEPADQGRADHDPVGHLADLGRLFGRRDADADADRHVGVAADPLDHLARLVAQVGPLAGDAHAGHRVDEPPAPGRRDGATRSSGLDGATSSTVSIPAASASSAQGAISSSERSGMMAPLTPAVIRELAMRLWPAR